MFLVVFVLLLFYSAFALLLFKMGMRLFSYCCCCCCCYVVFVVGGGGVVYVPLENSHALVF